jgi:hypothetical protein
MSLPTPDKFSGELLAAYADGELDADGRALVEGWLAAHPEATDVLRTQQEFSASNTALWDAAEPPQPNVAAWNAVRNAIAAELTPPATDSAGRSRGIRVAGWLLWGLTISGVASAISWAAFGPALQQPAAEEHRITGLVCQQDPCVPVAPEPHSLDKSADPLSEFAVLPMPTEDDVVLDRIPSCCGGWLPIGRHPITGTLELASADDVFLEEVTPCPAWSTHSAPKMTPAPGDAPMIFAAKPR